MHVNLIEITVNGERKSIASGLTLEKLIQELGLDVHRVAIEQNSVIIPRSQHAQTRLAAGDAIEIVHFIGGG